MNPILKLMTGLGLMVASLASAAPPAPPPIEALRVPSVPAPNAIPLYAGTAPGSEGVKAAEVWTHMWDQRMVRNVTRPTLEPLFPPEGRGNGTAVIVVPGGGFKFLSMDNEGYPIVQKLNALGVTAFLLKYRTDITPDKEQDFVADMMKVFGAPRETGKNALRPGVALAVADAQAALRLVRSHAAEWHLDPKRVGMIGFSAGAMTTLGVTLADKPDARADFIGVIYGPMAAVTVPADAPPMFNAMARDDNFFGHQGYGLIESWDKADKPVEFHLYDGGGHGFGSFPKQTTSDLWFEQFSAWMNARGLLKK